MKTYEEKLKKYTQRASKDDIGRISKKISSMNRGPVGRIWNIVMDLYGMIKDPDIPWQLKAVAVGALVYLISPIDAMPDIVPIAGLLDDAAVISAAVSSLGMAFKKFREKKPAEAEKAN